MAGKSALGTLGDRVDARLPSDLDATRWLAGFTIVFLYFPLALVIVMSFNANDLGFFPLTGFTLEWYRQLAADAEFWTALWLSVRLMVASAVVATLLALPAAYGFARLEADGAGEWIKGLLGSILLPMFIPVIFIGIALLLYLSAIGLDFGFLSVLLGHVIYVFPYTFLIIYAAVRSFPPAITEASRDLGASRSETFALVVLPQIFPSVISGFVFAMLLSLNEFIITFMVSGPDTFTMPLLIFDRLRRHLTPEMNAIGAMLLLSGLLVALFAARFDPRID
ncbi:ABC transporter permease [Halopenitus sp. POP-27]|uniref:ABC transporter permease n=1 Tax=Halopenitus sp. POP-27 TaxID=2994425 RepID=UPI002468F336|nr:ABC transporter permease [Halopenitus sp. POP-27]